MFSWYLYRIFPIVAIISTIIGLGIVYYIGWGKFRHTKLGAKLFSLYHHLRITDDFLTIEQRTFLSLIVISIAILLSIINPWSVTTLALFLASVATWAYYRGQDLRLIRKRKILLGVAGILVWLVVWVQFRTVIGHSAGIGAITILIALKLYELDRRRDAMILLFLSQVLVMGIFFFSQEIYAAMVALIIEVVLFAGQRAIFDKSGNFWGKQIINFKTSIKITAGALFLGVLLFVLFPRPADPIWTFGLPQTQSRSGLSDTMQPGSIDDLVLSGETAFQVEFLKNTPPPKNQLYWRGPAFSTFANGGWRRGATNSFSANYNTRYLQNQMNSNPANVFSYKMLIEPTYRNWLYALDTAVQVTPRAAYNSDGTFESDNYISTRTAFTIVSVTNLPRGNDSFNLSLTDRQTLLRLPNLFGNNEPQLRELAKSWLANINLKDSTQNVSGTPLSPLSAENSRKIVSLALEYFNKNEFIYTLKPPKLALNNPTDNFLFATKQGFCEHYSSAFTLLMRAAGIPARVVTGYQGGEINPLTGVLVVRQSDAHAWSEVWLEGEGWVRVDPTSAVAPERIEQSLSASIANSNQLSLLSQSANLSTIRSLLLSWEALQIQWNRWVIAFDRESQFNIFNFFSLPQFSPNELLAIVVLIFLIFLFIVYYQNRPQKSFAKIENKLWNKLIIKLKNRGIDVDETMTPTELYSKVTQILETKNINNSSPTAKIKLKTKLENLKKFVTILIQIKYAPINKNSRESFLTQLKYLLSKI